MIVSNVSLYSYYELQVQAQFPNEYTIEYTTKEMIKGIELAENAKGCSKLHTDYTNADGSQGILTFTCDPRDPIITPEEKTITELQIKGLIAIEADQEQRLQSIETLLGLR